MLHQVHPYTRSALDQLAAALGQKSIPHSHRSQVEARLMTWRPELKLQTFEILECESSRAHNSLVKRPEGPQGQ